ncbi:MAG: CcoQ/FixQ family Cbb3-type cytochrome c oxidase assembly chaperone [Epsilonproteobacteria bacterium]|nr:CcoQ/FixQ family Cbb3-type cytochrome c oxidase assembly chaperone [Campylobacterota bacterium]
MSQETALMIAGYGKFFLILFIFVIFYGYAISIYRRDKSGERDFEKYSNLVLDDSLDSPPLEKRERKKS